MFLIRNTNGGDFISIIELLLNFNLTRQESAIYLVLLNEGALTGYEVAKLTGISRSNTYTSLAGLTEKGAAYLMEDTAKRYIPVTISEFCDNRIKELMKVKQEIVKSIPNRKEETEGYITIKGQKHIFDKMRHMLNDAKERIYISLSNKIIENFIPELEECIKRGLKVVIITDMNFRLNGATVYYAQKPQDQIRLIVDSENVITGDVAEGENSSCLYSGKKNLIELFKESMRNEIKLIQFTKGE